MSQKINFIELKTAKYLLIIPLIFGLLVFYSCKDSNSKQNNSVKNDKTMEIPFLVDQVKEQIAVQGNLSDNEDNALNLLQKVMKGKEFDPKLVESVQKLIAQNNKSTLEQKVSKILDAIQIKGNISVSDEKAINDLLSLTVANN